MNNRNFKYIFLILTIFCSFFIGGKEVKASTCTYYSYEAGVYYDSSTGIYMPARLTTGQTLEYKLIYREKTGKDFTVYHSSDKKYDSYYSDDMLDYIEANGCPDYLNFYYLGASGGFYTFTVSNSDNYVEYLKNQYEAGGIITTDYNTFEPGFMCSKLYIDNGDFMSFTSVKTEYKSVDDIKLSNYSDEAIENIYSVLEKNGALKDKGQEYHYKEEYYDVTSDLWNDAIAYTYNQLESSCSSYTNKDSINRYEYLDLIDHDKFELLTSDNYIVSYNDALTKYASDGFTSSTVSEECYNTVIYAKFMQEAFLEWFNLVDWLAFTKADDANNFDTFSTYFEFAYLESSGGQEVKNFRDSMSELNNANTAIDDLEESNICTMICDENNLLGETSCKQNNETYKCCIENYGTTYLSCYSSISNIYETCMEDELESKCDGLSYSELRQKLIEYDAEKKAEIDEAADKIISLLEDIDGPELSGVDFNAYKVDCDDVSFLHTFYNIIRIIAPILVILFGSLDYTKSVIGADEQKILEARKKLPKRLILLLVLILVPFIISTILSIANVDTSLLTCIVNGNN